MTTVALSTLQVHEKSPVCESCGQAIPEPSVIRVDATTIANLYDVWPTRPSGKRTGPNLLVIELKVQR